VNESLYPLSVDANQLIETVNWMDNDLLDKITPALLGDRPNTYTFTKALAESLLVRECGSLPVAIVRPSIVTAAWNEPIRGWVDNINGPTGLILASGKGMLRTMYYDSDAIADLIPVDTVINMMIAVGWHTAVHRSNSIPIYNCASGSLNPITWGDIERICLPLLIQYPSSEVFRYPGGCFKNYWILNQMSVLLEHHLPAYAMDGVMAVLRRPQIMRRLYGKLHRAVRTLQYFTTRQWLFRSTNVLELNKRLNPIDQQVRSRLN
jgi:fatty acyl-CoA reductase